MKIHKRNKSTSNQVIKVFRDSDDISINVDNTGALFTLITQYEYNQTQCKEGVSDINVH